MRKIIFIFVAVFALAFFASGISAQMTFASQPNNLYNIGDVAQVSVNVGTNTDLNDFFSIDLLCNGLDTQVYRQYLNLASGAQKTIDASIPLSKSFVGGTIGTCKVKAIIGKSYILTNSFQVSNAINVTISSTGSNFRPGQQILVQGNAVKADGKNANGISNIDIFFGNNSVYNSTSAVTNGFFYFNFSLPENSTAGKYRVQISAAEHDSSGSKTNFGTSGFDMNVIQVPTNLELIFNNQSEIAGGTVKVSAVLHDQTGKSIKSQVNYTVVDGSGDVTDQEVKNTGDTLEIPISYNSPPAQWTVYATSQGLSTQSYFNVLVKEKIAVDVFNNTLLVSNKGNVPYDKPLGVQIGNNQSLVFNLSLGVGQSKRFRLSAPDGNYSVQVSSDGSNLFNGNLFLTGNAVNLQQASSKILSIVSYPWVWGFVVFILLVALFFIIRRMRKKKFTGKVNLNKIGKSKSSKSVQAPEGKISPSKDDLLPNSKKADMSLSMQGEKQDSSVVCVNIKNLDEIRSNKNKVGETLGRLVSFAESSKSSVYESGNYIFFIFAPIKTKTFKNERDAVQFAEQLKGVLDDHNRLFKQRIEYGISVSFGTIIARHLGEGLRFMSLGDFSSMAKRLSSLSEGEIVLGKSIEERLGSEIKAEKKQKGNSEFYVLDKLKDRTKNQKFIDDFLKKMQQEKKD